LTRRKCIAELRDKAESFKQTGRVKILDSELAVVKSDHAISEDLKRELIDAVKILEGVPARVKDWHPGSDQTVLDLVHPSLFPVVWGVTRALKEGSVPLDDWVRFTGKGIPVDIYNPPVAQNIRWAWPPLPNVHGSFQWLPAQVEVKERAAKITSYINNLHPVKHKPLYGILSRIVTATLPLFEDVLSSFQNNFRIDTDRTGYDDYKYPPGLYYQVPNRKGRKSRWDPTTREYVDENCNKIEDGGQNEWDEDEEDMGSWQWGHEYQVWKEQNRMLKWREPHEYTTQAEPSAVRLSDFPNGLQIIFKLANIVLTPEKPKYLGGSWHVEGTLNEMICASAIYYYDQGNITDSFLSFRQAMNTSEVTTKPEQNHHHSLGSYLGVEQYGTAIQELGRVLTREGRLLVFPNCLQHQVQPFELSDKSQPGHRKILAMFLVDPNRPILSSAVVPPQQKDWWADLIREEGGLALLHKDLYDSMMNSIDDFPLSWEQAVEYRAKLMEERSDGQKEFSEYMEGVRPPNLANSDC